MPRPLFAHRMLWNLADVFLPIANFYFCPSRNSLSLYGPSYPFTLDRWSATDLTNRTIVRAFGLSCYRGRLLAASVLMQSWLKLSVAWLGDTSGSSLPIRVPLGLELLVDELAFRRRVFEPVPNILANLGIDVMVTVLKHDMRLMLVLVVADLIDASGIDIQNYFNPFVSPLLVVANC